MYILKGPSVEENRAEIIFKVRIATDCPRKHSDRARAVGFQKKV